MKNDFCVFDCSTRGKRNQSFGAEGGTSQVPPPLLRRTVCGRHLEGGWFVLWRWREKESGLWWELWWPPKTPPDTHSPNSSSKAQAAGMPSEPFCRQHTPKSKRQLSFVMASRNNRSWVPGQRLQRLSSSSKEAPVEKKPVSTTQLLQWKIQTNWTSHPKARRF